MPTTVERVRHLGFGDLPVVLDTNELPRPDANEFLLGRLGRAANTLDNEARALIPLLNWLEHQGIDIWERVSSGAGFTEAEFRGGMIENLRRKSSPRRNEKVVDINSIVSPDVFNQRLTVVLNFVSWHHHQALVRAQSDDRLRERIQNSLSRIERIVSESYIKQSTRDNSARKHLTEAEQAFLIEKLNPDKCGIGATEAVQRRNFVTLMLLLSCGMRRGEVLSLRVQDLFLRTSTPQVNVTRRPDDPDDGRSPRPSVKRNGRPIPLDRTLAKAIQGYVRTWRNKLLDNATHDTDYLILSKDGRPLSLRGLNGVFERLRELYPEQLPDNFSPHTYRHTFSINFERSCRRAGLSEEQRQHALMYLRGDSSPQSQEDYIAAEVREKATQQLVHYQKQLLDDLP
jgi:integrase